MSPTGTPGQDAASIAVLQTQQQNIERQLTELQRSTGEHLSAISGKLDKLADMSLEIGRISQTIAHQSETVARAHARLDAAERDLTDHLADSLRWRESAQTKLDGRVMPLAAKIETVASTQHRWTGIYLGVQAVLGVLLALLLWVANGYITKVDSLEKQMLRVERQTDVLMERGNAKADP